MWRKAPASNRSADCVSHLCTYLYIYIQLCERVRGFCFQWILLCFFFKSSSLLFLSFSFYGSIGIYLLTRKDQVDEHRRQERREENLRFSFFFLINYPEQFFFNKNTKPRFSRQWRTPPLGLKMRHRVNEGEKAPLYLLIQTNKKSEREKRHQAEPCLVRSGIKMTNIKKMWLVDIALIDNGVKYGR